MTEHVVLVQARMSSQRFPGKMLAPLGGEPLIKHVLQRVSAAVAKSQVFLLTSTDKSDDPLVHYVSSLGYNVSRGPLDDVTERFLGFLDRMPCTWFARISGDSPALEPGLLAWMLTQCSNDADLVTNVAERTFPPGQSVEIVRSSVFQESTRHPMSGDQRQHVTLHLYRNPHVRVKSVLSADPSLAGRRMVVDTVDDLRALETILASRPEWTQGYAAGARVAQAV